MPPLASTMPEWPKSSNQPVSSGRVGAEEGELLSEPCRAVLDSGRRPAAACRAGVTGPTRSWRARLQPGQIDEIVVLAGVLDDLVEVADRRHEVGRGGAELAEERPEPVGDRLRGVDERVDVVERRPQVDRGRVEVAHEVGQLVERRRSDVRWRAIAPSSRRGSRPGPRGRHGGGDGRRQLRAVDDQLLERAACRGSAPRTCGRDVDRNGFRYLKPRFASSPTPAVGGGEALDHLLEVGDGLRIERVEELVEIDLGDRLGPRHRAARRGSPHRPCLGGGSVNWTWRLATPDEREPADLRDRAPLQRRVGAVDREGHEGVAVVGKPDLVRPRRRWCRRS